MAVPEGSVTSRFPVCSRSVPSLEARTRRRSAAVPSVPLSFVHFYVRMAAPGSTYKNSNQEQRNSRNSRNSRNTKSSQEFAYGTDREQDMEQLAMAVGTATCAAEPLVTDIGCVRFTFRYTGSYRGRMIRSCGDRAVQQLLDRRFRRKFQAIEKALVSGCQSWMLQPRFGI
jgi:hypothetical protein